MTEAELQITLAYMRGFGPDRLDWTPEKHVAGLKEVFRAGAEAERKRATSSNTRQESDRG